MKPKGCLSREQRIRRMLTKANGEVAYRTCGGAGLTRHRPSKFKTITLPTISLQQKDVPRD